MPRRKLHSAAAPAQQLLAWYDRHARRLPWRAPPGTRPPPPYRVWLSEVMLQQTTVATVGPYFENFVSRWPTVADLAQAPAEEVLAAWAGLGYYTRARKLHECAQVLHEGYSGQFPGTEEELRALPGIGPYTAAAIAAIAFNRPAAVVDGNIERVIARYAAIKTPLPAAKAEIKAKVSALMPTDRPGDFAQAMMDLGATLCSPKRPACALCPWTQDCAARELGLAEQLPKKLPKPEKPLRAGAAFWLQRPDGHVLLERRPPKGLLGGMLGFPTTEWRVEEQSKGQLLAQAPLQTAWVKRAGQVRHTFTHFHLDLQVFAATLSKKTQIPDGTWVEATAVMEAGLPTVMKKVAALALKEK